MSPAISNLSESTSMGVESPSAANGLDGLASDGAARMRANSGELFTMFDEAVRSHADEPFLLSPVAVSVADIGACNTRVLPLYCLNIPPIRA